VARIRYLKPQAAEDVKLAECSIAARLLYRDLWCHMDRQGLAEDEPKLIKKNVFPYDDDLGVAKIRKLIDELVAAGRLIRTEWRGHALLYCPTFTRHQKFHRDEEPKYRIPEKELIALVGHHAGTVPAPFNVPANSAGNGERGTGNGNGESDPLGVSSSAPHPVIPEFQEIAGVLAARRVSAEVQQVWLENYPDPPWVIAKIRRALAWELEKGRKKQRFSAFMGRWLAKDWDARRATAGEINTTPTNLETL
jgi:hypothetical protein